jgi:hypothetical protein
MRNKNSFSLIIIITTGMLLVLNSTLNAQQKKKNGQMLQSTKKSLESSTPDWHKKVRISPRAFITQTIGLTDVTISYSRPGVKGRGIWGGLVPYKKVWRAGANEATRLTFSNDVRINGKKFPAGSYSFFVIPHEKKDWTIIFNKVADQWGAFEYNEAEDFARFNIKPVKSNYHEWLSYTFNNMKVQIKGKNSAEVNLNWKNIRIPFTIETDVK